MFYAVFLDIIVLTKTAELPRKMKDEIWDLRKILSFGIPLLKNRFLEAIYIYFKLYMRSLKCRTV